ncbi:hypothetical protein NIIDMKKI_45020 [Mycobacterium kansasii]|uniref:Uncharacterized protein n=1 Tax=Mycobacterium kansasii TaxID=1768 RepID=A0A7G1IDX3_MYCKA|nr:hypothetical protein NIIDMKKI_45020 [Mycobacterium kansasii]
MGSPALVLGTNGTIAPGALPRIVMPIDGDRRWLAVEQLTTMEASFLEAEDADRHVSLAIGALAVIDGPSPGRDELVETLSERMRTIPG